MQWRVLLQRDSDQYRIPHYLKNLGCEIHFFNNLPSLKKELIDQRTDFLMLITRSDFWEKEGHLLYKLEPNSRLPIVVFTEDTDRFLNKDDLKLGIIEILQCNSSVEKRVQALFLRLSHNRMLHNELAEKKEAIDTSRQHFIQILNNLPTVAIQGYTTEGTVRYWNQASEKFYGYTAEEAIGANILDLIIPLEMHQSMLVCMKDPEKLLHSMELNLKRKDGTTIPIASSFTLFPTLEEEHEIFCFDMDLTEHRQLEDTQNFLLNCGFSDSREDFFESLVKYIAKNLAIDYVQVCRLSTDLHMATPLASCKHQNLIPEAPFSLEGTPESILLKTSVYHENKLKEKYSVNPIKKQVEACTYYGVSLINPDREKIGTLSLYSSREPFNLKQIEAFMQLAIPRIEGELHRTLIETKLRESEEQFENFFQRAPLGYQSLDEEGYFLEVNEAWLEALGYKREEVVGKRFVDFLAPEYVEGFRNRFPIFKERGKITSQFEMRHKNGTRRFIQFEGRIGHHQNGTFERTHCILQDITERIQAQQEKEKLQDQLNQVQKMESVGRLAGGIAHDFNNMLGVILGHVDMAKSELTKGSLLYEDLEEIQQAAERSAELTRQLLTFARKQTIIPRVLNLNHTIDGIQKMLRRLIGEDIDLIWKPDEQVGNIFIDPIQVDQILANLCINARDAINDIGTITIETKSTSFDEEYCAGYPEFLPGDYHVLAVSDTGCGMDRETVTNIFEPFFTTKEVGKGTGLGLSTVYGIIKQNNGLINVYSEPGHGTTFRLYFKQYLGDDQTSEEVKKYVNRSLQGNKIVLIVEDEPAILKMTETMLKKQGYQVLSAGSPDASLKLARETDTIDLLITDVVMPKMNGSDLAQKIQAIHPDIRKLFMSGYTSHIIEKHGILNSDVHFIQKPFTIDELTAKIQNALK